MLLVAGGGAGWLSDGKDGTTKRQPAGQRGFAVRNGAKGGKSSHSSYPNSVTSSREAAYYGGFGGGGSPSDNTGSGRQ